MAHSYSEFYLGKRGEGGEKRKVASDKFNWKTKNLLLSLLPEMDLLYYETDFSLQPKNLFLISFCTNKISLTRIQIFMKR